MGKCHCSLNFESGSELQQVAKRRAAISIFGDAQLA